MDLISFAQRLAGVEALQTAIDRGVALIWFASRVDPTVALSARQIAQALQGAGYPKQNVSRLNAHLKADKRTVKASGDGFRLQPAARGHLASILQEFAGPQPAKPTHSLIPRSLADATRRSYLQRVTHQINASYDAGLFDCTAVMMRRMIETLIIELFESRRWEARIKDSNGHFLMLDNLIGRLDNEPEINLSRNTKLGLRKLKDLGDKSAHNRRFNAQKSDIDQLAADVRAAAEELMHLANLLSPVDAARVSKRVQAPPCPWFAPSPRPRLQRAPMHARHDE